MHSEGQAAVSLTGFDGGGEERRVEKVSSVVGGRCRTRRRRTLVGEVRVSLVGENGAEPEGLVREGVGGRNDHRRGDVDLVAAMTGEDEEQG